MSSSCFATTEGLLTKQAKAFPYVFGASEGKPVEVRYTVEDTRVVFRTNSAALYVTARINNETFTGKQIFEHMVSDIPSTIHLVHVVDV